MRSLLLVITLVYSSMVHSFYETLGLQLLVHVVKEVVSGDRSAYRGSDYESPVKEYIVDSEVATRCDPYGGCDDYVAVTTTRKVKEYRYDWDPRWIEWGMNDYQ